MDINTHLHDMLSELQRSDSRQQIESSCNAFCRQMGFEHYILFGSIITSLLSSPHCVISNLDKTASNKKQLATITQACMDSSTPFITGNIEAHSLLSDSMIKTCRRPSARSLSISFPVHFPLGKLAFLHISTPVRKQDIDEKVLSTLAVGNLFAHEAGTAILRLLERELGDAHVHLSPCEKEFLLLAADGTTPAQIARQTGLSAHTVIYHLKKAREKLQTRSIQGAVSKAMLRGDIAVRIGSEKA